MKRFLTFALVAMVALSASAAKKKAPAKNANKPVFTVIKENPITTIKDQNRSGTCWDYSTLSFFEAEILKATGKKYTLCEAFVANKTYMERAIQVVRYHGDCQFAQGGSAEDVLQTLKTYGICPIDAMPFPGRVLRCAGALCSRSCQERLQETQQGLEGWYAGYPRRLSGQVP